MEAYDTRENRGKLVVPQKPTSSNFLFLKAMQLSPLSVHHLIYFLLWMRSWREVPVSSSSPWTPEGMIRLYPLSWSESESKLHTLTQPDDISDPSTGRRDRRPVWTCKHTETHFSVRFLTANGTYSEVWLVRRSESRPVRSDLWTNRRLNWTIHKVFIRHDSKGNGLEVNQLTIFIPNEGLIRVTPWKPENLSTAWIYIQKHIQKHCSICKIVFKFNDINK